MTVTIDLPADLEARVRTDAQAQGMETSSFLSALIVAWYTQKQHQIEEATTEGYIEYKSGRPSYYGPPLNLDLIAELRRLALSEARITDLVTIIQNRFNLDEESILLPVLYFRMSFHLSINEAVDIIQSRLFGESEQANSISKIVVGLRKQI